ncbi:hypothetical protein BJ878DRAFT_25375 [Calycina marina]|uniref:Uncharacterized protein n=1 Tax=Calycina marina TaxID=1763456 RepID=A0A9P7Z5K0_9HELO|nr:hypothetical protein BJ878DRAFT_25375 [Calycina marina]
MLHLPAGPTLLGAIACVDMESRDAVQSFTERIYGLVTAPTTGTLFLRSVLRSGTAPACLSSALRPGITPAFPTAPINFHHDLFHLGVGPNMYSIYPSNALGRFSWGLRFDAVSRHISTVGHDFFFKVEKLSLDMDRVLHDQLFEGRPLGRFLATYFPSLKELTILTDSYKGDLHRYKRGLLLEDLSHTDKLDKKFPWGMKAFQAFWQYELRRHHQMVVKIRFATLVKIEGDR